MCVRRRGCPCPTHGSGEVHDCASLAHDSDDSDDSVVELETSTPPAVITITSSEPSWLSIRKSDGSELFEGTLADSKTLPADADVEIYAGRPDLVLISRGEETPKALGTIEEVRWYKLNP